MSRTFRANAIRLGANIELRMGAAAPDAGAGVVAPVGSFYWRTSTFETWQKVGAANTAWVFLTPRDLFGNGFDGNVVIAAGTTSLVRDMYYNTLTISAGGILRNRGFRIFVRDRLTINVGGSLQENGGDGGTTGTAGAGGGTASGQAGTVQNVSLAGGAGAAGVGGAGNGGTNGIFGATGFGGAGGAGTGGAGGVGGIVTATPADSQSNPRALVAQSLGTQVTGISGPGALRVRGGAGGGAGGGNGAAAGGGGGGGGGLVYAVARDIVNNGTIQAHGGAGGNAANAGAGGGGGGGGGLVLLGFHHLEGNVPTVTGGALGTGNGAGANGVAGVAGNYIPLAL